jgi:PKD repeat protein
MRKSIYYLGSALLVVGVLMGLGTGPGNPASTLASDDSPATSVKGGGGEAEKGKIPMRDRVELALRQEIMMTKDPVTGDVPRERLIAARHYADELRAANKVTAALSVSWDERGPSNVAGRTRAIMVDPNDGTGNTVFAGSVGGGLFKTTNITATAPNWTPVNDLMANLAICALAYDPSNTQVMYAGTGEGYFNSDAIRGLGIFKSTNGGTTWAQLASTNNATFRYVYKVVVTSTGIVLAGTQSGGVQRSTNGGTTWTKVLGTGLGITGAVSNVAYDVDIAANGDVYATLDGSIHKSTNAGATFGAAQTLPITASRVEIGLAPSDANYAYALVENGNVVNGILQTTNGGTTWTSRTEPDDLDGGIAATDFSRGQAWYDLSIGVDPNNRDRLFVGGVDLFGSLDGGATWTQVGHWYGGFGVQYVHADQHTVLFQPGNSNVCYFGNDGGVHRTDNASAALPTISFKGTNYNVTQFYSCAIHPTALSDYFLAGSQDNGSHQFNNGGINATVEVTGGDGGFCHIDQDQPQYQFTSYVYNDFYRSADGGINWTSVGTTGGMFISPTDYDNLGNRLYGHSGTNNYMRWDNPQTGNTFAVVAVAGFGGQVASVCVSPNTANRVFFGITNGDVFRVDNAHTATPTATNISTGLPAGYPSCVEVEIGNDNHLLVCYTNYGTNSIWESVNAGATWTSVEGNMPDMPVRWLLLNPNDNTQAIAATELGVWYTDLLSGGATNWVPGNSGLANTRVDMLQLRTSDDLVIAATHGRGLYSSDVFTSPTALFTSNRRISYIGAPVQFIDQSYRGTSWAWDFGDGGTSTLQNPTHNYATAGLFNVTLTINSGASTLTKNNWIQVLPDLGTPYAPADGGNFETNVLHFGPENLIGTDWERGNSAVAGKNGTTSPNNAWVTGLVGNYVNNTVADLYCPSYNFSAPGTYTLRFQTRFNAELNYDGYRVEYSLDKGATWIPLGTTVAANWYNNANASGSLMFPSNEAFFSGNAGAAYALKTRDVSFLAGNPSVAFRFPFRTDVSVTGPGVAIDDFEILGPGNPGGLPITGSPLYGAWTTEQPTLTWTTYTESNVDGFAVERSADGVSFTDVGFVNAQGTSVAEVPYRWKDPTAVDNHYYYRLRQVELDGNVSYTNTVELSRGDGAVGITQVFPNPFTDHVTAVLSGPGEGVAQVELFDLSGRKIMTADDVSTASNAIRLEGLNLPSGTYLLRITVGAESLTRKIVRQ